MDARTSFGERLRRLRERAGMSRPQLGGLVGRSGEWVKALETGRLQVPRLPMLLLLAQVLELSDLAALTGNGHAVPVQVFAGERHAALTAVSAALTDYRVSQPVTPPSVPHVALRLQRAWQIRHSTSDHRTQLGRLLPDLIRDAQRAVRATSGETRRDARRVLAGVYQLADFYVAYQPAPELVWMVADRALNEGQEADDPYVMAGGAWAMVQALRDAGRWAEAVALAQDANRALEPWLAAGPDDWRGLSGALHAEIAYVHARRGRSGAAWAALERADAVARNLGPNYRHVQTSFSQSVMAAHATTVGVELRHPGAALQAANSIDADMIPSLARRSRHLIEVARAHHQRGERHATLALLDKAERTATETIHYNGFARELLLDLSARPPAGMRDDVRGLCSRVGLAV
jgi:transcriptional regulator with XRE-family HTH domain